MAMPNQSKQLIVYCLLCKARIKFRGDIDFNKFNGQICCDKCETLLGIVILKNKLQGLKVVEKGWRRLSSKELVDIAETVRKEAKKLDEEATKSIEQFEREGFPMPPKPLDLEKGQT